MPTKHGNLWWRADRRQLPTPYVLEIDGRELTVLLVKKEEAADEQLYEWIRKTFNKDVYAVGVAAGSGACNYYPRPVHVVEAPMYYKGHIRKRGIERLWQMCKCAARLNMAVLVHCNQSFHRGPLLMAALMIHAGHSLADALDCIACERSIYAGHLLDHGLWPRHERTSSHAKDLLEAHKFLREAFEPGCGLQQSASSQAADNQASSQTLATIDLTATSNTPARDAYLSARRARRGEEEEERAAPPLPPPPNLTLPEPSGVSGAQPAIAPAEAAAPSTTAADSPCVVDNGLQPDVDDAPAEELPDWGGDDESDVWTDEDDHKAWKSLSLEEKLNYMSGHKRRIHWTIQHSETEISSGLQPGAAWDQLPEEMQEFLRTRELRNRSHTQNVGKLQTAR